MRITRLTVLLAVLVLVASACSGTATPAPSSVASPTTAATDAPEPTGAPEPTDAPEPTGAEPTDAPEPTPGETTSEPSQPPSGDEAELRWYCCLGTGEDAGAGTGRAAGRR